MEYVEPVIGLFHLQMCMLGTIFKAHWGNDGREPVSILRFVKLLRKPAINTPKPKDFRAYDQFFQQILEAHVISLAAETLNADTVELFNHRLRAANWRLVIEDMVDAIFPVCGGLSVVKRRRFCERGIPVPHQSRDILYENAILLLQQGLVYADYGAAVCAGDPGRLEHIIRLWTTQLHGTQNINYPREVIHLIACMEKIWSPELRNIWRHNCLVNPSGRRGAWVPDDLFGEYVVREIKARIHPSSNIHSDQHLRETISRQVMSLHASKVSMERESRAHSYGTHSSLVRSSTDVANIVRVLLDEAICRDSIPRALDSVKEQPHWEATDLMGAGIARLATGVPLREYMQRARFSWHPGKSSSNTSSLDLETEEDFDTDILGPEAGLDDLL